MDFKLPEIESRNSVERWVQSRKYSCLSACQWCLWKWIHQRIENPPGSENTHNHLLNQKIECFHAHPNTPLYIEIWRFIPVEVRPGSTAFTVTPVPVKRLAKLRVNRIFANLLWLYASVALYNFSLFKSSVLILPSWCDEHETFIIRLGADSWKIHENPSSSLNKWSGHWTFGYSEWNKIYSPWLGPIEDLWAENVLCDSLQAAFQSHLLFLPADMSIRQHCLWECRVSFLSFYIYGKQYILLIYFPQERVVRTFQQIFVSIPWN